MSTKLTVSYERVSSVSQNLDRQTVGLSQITAFDRTYSDKVSGSIPFSDRPAGRRLMDDIQKGLISTIYFWECSRIGRDVADIHQTLKYFRDFGVQVFVHKEGIRLLNDDGTPNQTAALVLSVMAALSEIERQNIKERQMQGIALARVQGKYLGRRKGTSESAARFLTKPKSKKIAGMIGEGYMTNHIAKVIGCSVNTVTKVKNLM